MDTEGRAHTELSRGPVMLRHIIVKQHAGIRGQVSGLPLSTLHFMPLQSSERKDTCSSQEFVQMRGEVRETKHLMRDKRFCFSVLCVICKGAEIAHKTPSLKAC